MEIITKLITVKAKFYQMTQINFFSLKVCYKTTERQIDQVGAILVKIRKRVKKFHFDQNIFQQDSTKLISNISSREIHISL